MKKVININFQGQVIPIEETAYEMLQQYVASLRNYFANEEGRDEIINDIESRIAELFGETLKKGAACISDEEVNRIMNSMGRPSDFEAAEEGEPASSGKSTGQQTWEQPPFSDTDASGRKRLYRDEQDKIIGGVASGLANYFRIDPAIIRVIFVALFFGGGSGLLVYIILWIILPSRSLVTNIRKRLYRDPDSKVIGGVAGGLAKYFDISPAIPRVIFAAPFILAIITGIWNSMFSFFPSVLSGFGGGTFILAYIILWIVLPEARTAAEKLEMRGEKVDLNSIRNTVVSDLEGLKAKTETLGKEMKETAERLGTEVKDAVQEKGGQMAGDVRMATRRHYGGLGNALGILVKAFVYFIVGIVAFALFMAAIGLFVGGVTVYPFHDYLLQGSTQHFALWGTVLLFLCIPILALLVFIIRKLMGAKKSNPYIGYTFAALWIVGLVSVFILAGTMNRAFSTQVGVREELQLTQPSGNILKVFVNNRDVILYDDWLNTDGVFNISRDTLYMSTIKVNVVKSKDSAYHAYLMKISRGDNRENAERRAGKIEFAINQQDSLLSLPANFKVSRQDKWRNQKLILVIEVPEGKYIELDESLEDYRYFNVHFNNRMRNGDWDFDWNDGTDYYRKGERLQMKSNGLERFGNGELNGKYHFNLNDGEIKVEGEIKIDEKSKEEKKKEAEPVIEQKEKEVYRYSSSISEENGGSFKGFRISANPLSAMLRI